MRERFRFARNDLASASRERMDQAIHQALLSAEAVQQAERIAAYAAFDGEPDLTDAMMQLAAGGKAVYLPVIGEANDTAFHRFHPGETGPPNRYGIMEPANGDPVEPTELDLVLLPLVAWSAAGERVGMGAGYYDRALSGVRELARPLRVGVAYELQKTDRIPADPWDVRLHAVVTERGWFTCG